MKFSDLSFSKIHGIGGFQDLWDHAEHIFSNNHGVSIIRGNTTVGGPELYEVNIIHNNRILDNPRQVVPDWKHGNYTEEEIESLMEIVESY